MGIPYIGRCNYDGAYETLQHIYGNLEVTCCYVFRNNQYTAKLIIVDSLRYQYRIALTPNY